MKHIITQYIHRYGHTYRVVGHFFDKSSAKNYKEQSLHSLLITSDEPNIYGKDVKYHVYRRED